MLSKYLKCFFLPLFMMGAALSLSAQISGGLYTDKYGVKAAIGYNFTDRLWAEGRVGPVNAINFSYTDLLVHFNYVKRPSYEVYVGAGIQFSDLLPDAFIINPIGLSIRPFTKVRNWSIAFELGSDTEYGLEVLRGRIGIRYLVDRTIRSGD
ncbi:MAG: hypothetical protein J5I52_03325 [Saprospiraceae bacterium]|nr:MAG: hypothetical protein UZ09_BCD002000290 [Bacteroidetes bacterium OLB9]MCO6463162.1 hypothetical protein [Saprospiraceae bacterium]MCZ2337927.1 hypothetical protein [Chitinophagales bacterium]